MRRKFAAVVGAVSLVGAVAAAPASAASGNSKSCVGQEVSSSAHITQQIADVGFGAFLHQLGLLNPGQVIQAYDAAVCDAPTGG